MEIGYAIAVSIISYLMGLWRGYQIGSLKGNPDDSSSEED